MSFLYSLYSYYFAEKPVEEETKAILLFSNDELRAKIAEITKNKKPPVVIEGFGKVKRKKIDIVYVTTHKKMPGDILSDIKKFQFKEMKQRAKSDKTWVKICESSEDIQKETLSEIEKIKKNLVPINKRISTFKEKWDQMTKYDSVKWEWGKK